MADLGTIGIAIEVKGRDALRQIESDMTAVDKTAKSAARSFEVFERAGLKTADTFRYMSEESARRLKEESRITQEIVKQTRAAEQLATANAKAYQASVGRNLGLGARGISASASAGAFEQEIERLRLKYDQVYASSQLYQRSLDELNRAHMLGVTSAKQHEAAVESLNLEYQNFQNGIVQAGNRFAQYSAQTASGMNQFGVVTQQAGYQIGDFLVQVQSGTNWMVAFGQQATQLVGILPLMGAGFMGLSAGALIALSAGLGIAIPLVTAIGAAWMRTSEEVKEGADKQKQAYESVTQALEDLRLEQQMQTSGAETKSEQVLLNEIVEAAAERKVIAQELLVLETQVNAQYSLAIAAERGRLATRDNELRLVQQRNQLILDEIEAERERAAQAERAKQAVISAYEVYARTRIEAEQVAEQVKLIEEGLSQSAVDGAILAGLDLSNLSDAAMDVLMLATNMGIAVEQAAALSLEQGRLDRLNQNAGRGSTSGRAVEFGTGPNAGKTLQEVEAAARKAASGAKKLKDGFSEAERAAEALRKELEGPLVGAVGGISNAFGDFISRGLSDFKGFVSQILGSFQSMIAQMIAMAVRNRIMLSLGIGGVTPAAAAAGQVAGLGSATTMLGSLGTGTGLAGIAGGSGFLGGMGNTISGLAGGGAGFFGIGGNAAAAGGGALATIGAAIPVIGAVAAAISFFRSKTKELDNGLRITVTNMDALVQSFQTVEKSRFFGLSKKVRTTLGEVSDEASGPIVKAVQDIQTQIIKAANIFGVAEDAFDNFTYNLEVSLKGLTEDQKIQKVNEELAKMGDSFAALTGHFSTMNELLEAANQRMEIQNRLDRLLGNNQAILQRQREAEIAATHELNRPLLNAVFALEDAQGAVDRAFAALRSAIDKTVQDLQAKLSVANEAVNRSRGIFNQLEGALSGRFLRGSDNQFMMRRSSALSFLRRGNFDDERQLEEALGVVAEPTEDLFRTFEDYARDFYRTSAVIEEAKKVAQVQLTADEKQVTLLEKQIEDAQGQYDLMMQQYNELLGIKEGTLSVEEAVKGVQEAIKTLAEAIRLSQMAAAIRPPARSVDSGSGGGSSSNFVVESGTVAEQFKGGVGLVISGMNQFLKAASDAGVSTAGKTAEQIRQEISGNLRTGVLLEGVGSYQRFAAGGMFGGGVRIVGERGPELEATGPARIFNHKQTAEMFRDPELAGSVERLKEEVSRMRSEQFQIQLEISKNIKRTYDIERKWDVDGLPATRT